MLTCYRSYGNVTRSDPNCHCDGKGHPGSSSNMRMTCRTTSTSTWWSAYMEKASYIPFLHLLSTINNLYPSSPHLLPLLLPSFVISALYPPRPIALTSSSTSSSSLRFSLLLFLSIAPLIYLLTPPHPPLWVTGEAAAAVMPSRGNGSSVYPSFHLSV